MLLAIWDDGVWQDAALFASIILGAYVLVVWVAAMLWVYRDAASRTRDQAMQAIAVLVVFVFNLPGLILYLIVRPKETLAERYDRQLEAQALLHEIQDKATCPSCRRKIEEDFLSCPYCRATLRMACENCSRALATGWVVCPYCGAERGAQRAPQPKAPVVAASTTPASPDGERQPRPRRAPSTATYTPPARGASSPADPAADPGS